MADKRISQLVDRGTVANNDVVPIVVSGATTTNKATISSIQTFMQGNLDLGVTSVGITLGSSGTDVNVTGSPITSSGNITINFPTASATNRGLLSSADWTTFNNKVSSVGLSMPSAFSVANSPITGSGTIAVTGAGTVSQYIRGDGSLADFPSGGGGGGSSVNYYLNGSVSQGTIGGIAYQEMNKVPVLGAGTDFVAITDGYLASFITDAGDPALLEIPAGNWNFETYFSASSGGGTPTFYIELYKVNSGGTATLIASNSANPELIAFGTITTAYFSSLAVPPTVLTLTDRLALRYYVTHSGRTITMHTEDANLCQVITTFTTGLTALNGLTAQVQNFATGTSGTDFNISSSSATHTFNLPDASASNRGAVTTGSQIFGGVKTFANGLSLSAVGGSNQVTRIVNIGTLHEGSASLNQIGFNSGNNIYFGKGLSNGGVISWNNAAVRYYTLPDADGTIALTSQIPTNPVGGTGAAGRVAYWNGTGTITSDSLFQWNDFSKRLGIGRTPTVSLDVEGAGFFSTSVTSQQNNITADGAGVVLQGYVDNALRIAVRGSGYNSGARGGLLASTGDFSGALNGTSATFSGGVSSNFNGSAYNATATSTNNVFTTYSNNSAANNTYIGIVANNGVVQTNNDFEVFTGSAFTKRLAIASTGYLKASNNGVYLNSTGTYHEISQNLNNAVGLVVAHTGNSSPYGIETWFTNADPNNATNYAFAAYTGTNPFVSIYKIFSNGTVSSRSDARWKKNIETTRNGYIDDLCKLRVVKYNWYNHEDDAPKELGLIAQEVEEVFPNLINIEPVIAKREVEQEDGTIIEEEFEDGVSRSIKTSVLPYMLLKAMQEQQEQIKELQKQIDSLKNQMQ